MYKEQMQEIIDYIENNLRTEITAAELADIAGYSVFHFYRIFQGVTGMPVMQYILRRKLQNAIYDIGSGRKKTEAVAEYGFETYAGFYKAFVRELGYTPADYLREFRTKKPYRINLLQEEHIMMSHRKIQEILACWGLEDETVADVVYPESGAISDTAKYIGTDYVIKYTGNPGNVARAIRITKALENVGLYAPAVVPTKDGKEYVQKGELYFFLTRRVKGERVLASKVYLEDFEQKGRFIGEIIGQLDLALQQIDVPADEADSFAAVRDWALPALKETLSADSAFTENYLRAMERLYGALPRQMIHRDPNPGNIIVSGDKWGFIDFELSERNVRTFDPCYAATAILSETFEEGNETKLARWTGILKEILYGYDSVVRLTAEEKEAVPYMVLTNQLISTAWFADKDRYRDQYETNLKMTRWIIRNFDKLKL
ncbi:helix-turn-helix domain-containing protein [Aristaeella lactis]|uniref:AraC-type DNA-binding protein n=1 Tax=Aristaeella lactis TaxID=3046383 RepID=A0AC61PN29_9FIRM|nr:helix-turn-helix domain-containing protein [Aristaeella lactis]QUA52762.1 phosphotransferase [Aristaeella lactis]SMC73102.1 AraC-type DNA-binding protein [Aristaeella lactis]